MRDTEGAGGKRGEKNQERAKDILIKAYLLCGSTLIVGSVFLLGDFVTAEDETHVVEAEVKMENKGAEETEDIAKEPDKDAAEEENSLSKGDSVNLKKSEDKNQDDEITLPTIEQNDENESDENKDDAEAAENEKMQKGVVVINEVMLGQEGFTKNEFIELYNATNENIDLDGWNLKKMTKSGSKSNLLSSSKFEGVIEKGGYFVIAHPSYESIAVVNAVYSGSSYSISKDNTVVLYDNSGGIIDALCWGACEHECPGEKYDDNPKDGMSISRTNEEYDNYAVSRVPTPGEKNQFPSKEEYSKLLRFNEVLPNPEGTDKNNEWIELMSLDPEEIDLSGWIIENGSGKRFTIKKEVSSPGGLLVVVIENTSLSVRNNSEQLSLLDPNEDVVDKVTIDGYASSGLSYNKTSQGAWRWSRFLTPGVKNKFNNQPKIKIKKSKNIYKNIYAEFDASKTSDKDKDKLKFRWDFGDGHKSYLKETKHKYDKKGKYKVILVVDDGSEKIEKSFRIEVKSYPRRELRITKLVPNPSGNDRENEIIVIRNLYKKRINLEGYKLATGRSKSHLVNHPVYNDFIIRAGEEKEITNEEICKFSLLNKKGVVVLKYPDGKIADIVSYEKEKIGNDEEYVLVFDEWEWIGGEDANVQSEIPNYLEIVQGTSVEKSDAFDFLSITRNETEKICECLSKIKIENWKNRNKNWLEVLNFRKNKYIDKSMENMYSIQLTHENMAVN